MLIPQEVHSVADRMQGSSGVSLAELRRSVADPSTTDDGHRQRLLELAKRLARVQLLGDEYSRVNFSDYAVAAIEGNAATA